MNIKNINHKTFIYRDEVYFTFKSSWEDEFIKTELRVTIKSKRLNENLLSIVKLEKKKVNNMLQILEMITKKKIINLFNAWRDLKHYMNI